MTSIRNKFATVETVLVSAVADDATFTVSYPSGFSQASFLSGMDASGGYIIFNGNDRWNVADPGISVAFGASLITVTNLTGASLPAGTTVLMHLEVENGPARIPFTIPLPPLATITAADIVTEMQPGIEGVIEAVEFVTTIAVTTGSRLADINLEIDTTNLTGGVVSLTSAAATPKGKVIAGSAITGNNRLTRESKLSIEAANVTAFAEGEGYLVVYIRPDAPDQY